MEQGARSEEPEFSIQHSEFNIQNSSIEFFNAEAQRRRAAENAVLS